MLNLIGLILFDGVKIPVFFVLTSSDVLLSTFADYFTCRLQLILTANQMLSHLVYNETVWYRGKRSSENSLRRSVSTKAFVLTYKI